MRPAPAPAPAPPVRTIPILWPGQTFAILGSGPSLTRAQIELCRARHWRLIAINRGFEIAPDADVIYWCDRRFGEQHAGDPRFAYHSGLRISLENDGQPADFHPRNAGPNGFEVKRDGLRTGLNSGYQAIQLARHLGAARIVLLGYDMHADPRSTHWHEPHPWPLDADIRVAWRARFPELIPQLTAEGIEVINATCGSALDCFPKIPLEDLVR
jgi:hypothetical protein